VARLTPEDVAQLVAWFETAGLPMPPFRSAPWSEIHEPEAWRAVMLRDLRRGPAGAYWPTVLQERRWLARRIAPPVVQVAAHVDELVERQGRWF